MRKFEELPTRELRRLRKRFASSAIYAEHYAQVELELIRRAERAQARLAWIALIITIFGLWAAYGALLGLLEIPH